MTASASGPIRAVVTGAPGGGKSTLLEAVAHYEIATGPEVARTILQAPGGMELRANDPQGFAMAMLEAQRDSWEKFSNVDGPVLFDRGFADIVGFLQVEGLEVPAPIDRVCREYRYRGPIFHARPWRAIYRQDAERIQTWDEAVASDAAVAAAWRHYGYTLIPLPETSPQQRAQFVLDHLGEN